jgi:hypothetical protein
MEPSIALQAATSSAPPSTQRTRRIGAHTAMILSALLGGLLAGASNELRQCLVVAAVAAIVTLLAGPLGSLVAIRSLDQSKLRAACLSILAALVCMLVAVLSACVLFVITSRHGSLALDVLWSEPVSFMFIVFSLFGTPIAIVLGALHGVVVHSLARAPYAL